MNDPLEKIVIDATLETFRTMVGVELNVDSSSPTDELYDISAIIGFSGTLVGNVALSVSFATAQKAAEKLVGCGDLEYNEVLDGIAEFINTIAGTTRALIGGGTVTTSLPEIIAGKNHHLDFKRYAEKIQVSFSSEIGSLALSFAFKECEQ